MVAIKLLFLTIFTLVNLSNGKPRLLKGHEHYAAKTRFLHALRYVAAVGGPKYKVSSIGAVSNEIRFGSLDIYDVDLFIGTPKPVQQCQVKIWSRPWKPGSGINIKISCDGTLEFETDY
ncbi:cystatin-like protein [Drosophila albomicans]|uniref:Cystatin-like protein n=1 Tax=Drosophila albomicans TaxID=7291 RepID=A0A6P8ZA29_DROAB|nr:cystatin-like protein [Drosophila albomicans]